MNGEGGRAAADVVVAIPTYRRPQLVRRLLCDLQGLSLPPKTILVVDGGGEAASLAEAIASVELMPPVRVILLTSEHANLPFQRFLAFMVAAEIVGATILVYLDDDVRPAAVDSLEALVAPLRSRPDVVATTARLVMGHGTEANGGFDAKTLNSAPAPRWLAALAKRFGGLARAPDGGLTPSGTRARPAPGERARQVSWLHGGAMACRLAALSPDAFPEALLSSYERRLGKGEDTILSLRLRSKGRFLYQPAAVFLHPYDAPPAAYSPAPYRYGLSVAYSRRLINDNYRYPDSPTFSDRSALIVSLAGMLTRSIWRLLVHPSKRSLAFALGTAAGVSLAVLYPPRAGRLTPAIDWTREVRANLERRDFIVPPAPVSERVES